MAVIVTDYGTMNVKPETEAFFTEYFTKPGLKQSTIERRATDAMVAAGCFLQKEAWEKGKERYEF